MQLIDRICGALFNCYRTEETDLHLFVLLFIPHLTYSYLNSIAHVDKQVSNIIFYTLHISCGYNSEKSHNTYFFLTFSAIATIFLI